MSNDLRRDRSLTEAPITWDTKVLSVEAYCQQWRSRIPRSIILYTGADDLSGVVFTCMWQQLMGVHDCEYA